MCHSGLNRHRGDDVEVAKTERRTHGNAPFSPPTVPVSSQRWGGGWGQRSGRETRGSQQGGQTGRPWGWDYWLRWQQHWLAGLKGPPPVGYSCSQQTAEGAPVLLFVARFCLIEEPFSAPCMACTLSCGSDTRTLCNQRLAHGGGVWGVWEWAGGCVI